MVEIANAFARQGHKVHLLVLKPVGPLASNVDESVKVVSLDAGRMLFSLPRIVAYLWRERPAVLLATDEYTHLLAIVGRMIARTDTRIVLRIGNMLTELFSHYVGFKSKMLPFFVRRLYKRADAVVANSRGVADEVIAVTKIDPEKITVIINPKPRQKILAQSKEPAGHDWLDMKTLPVVLAVGRLRVQKNFTLLIRAFESVSKDIPSRLVIVGGGREEGRLRTLITELGCEDRVSLPGYSDNPYSFMSKADLFVSASLWEGMPNSLLEATVCGLPIIAADCSSGPREILAPDTDYKKRLERGVEQAHYGVLTAVDDEEALADALKEILGDAELRHRYAQLSYERSRDFDARDLLDDYARILNINS